MGCSLPDSSVHGISRQGYWNRLPFPSLGDLPHPGIKLVFPVCSELQVDSLPPESSGKPLTYLSLTVFGWTVRTVGGEDGGAKTATAYGEEATLSTSPGLEWNVLGKLVSGSCCGGSRFC